MSKKRRVVLLAGGRSSEHAVSLASGQAVLDGLNSSGHDVVPIMVSPDGQWFAVENFATSQPIGEPVAIMPAGGLFDAEVVFPVLHGPHGEDGSIQGVLESLDCAYVGSPVPASAICLDKIFFKQFAGQAGIPQVEYVAIEAADWRGSDARRERLLKQCEALNLPLFVKPARLGSSVGISRVAELTELVAAIDNALSFDPRVIVEAAAEGAEIECSVLGNLELEVSRPGMLEFDGDWYDFDAKYEAGGMRLTAPADLEHDVEIQVCSIAARAYRAVGCAGMARVDFFVDGNQIVVNEINTIPGFTATSVFAKLFDASGLAYSDLLDRLLELAIERHRRERSFSF